MVFTSAWWTEEAQKITQEKHWSSLMNRLMEEADCEVQQNEIHSQEIKAQKTNHLLKTNRTKR